MSLILKGRQVNYKMKVERFLIGIISTNCYLAINEETKQTVVIDPAASPASLMEHIKTEGLKIEAILLTHGHFDHTMGLDGFLKEYDVPVYVHEGDKEIIADPGFNLSSSYTSGFTFSDAEYLQGGETLKFAGYDVRGRAFFRGYAVRRFGRTVGLSGKQRFGSDPVHQGEASSSSG